LTGSFLHDHTNGVGLGVAVGTSVDTFEGTTVGVSTIGDGAQAPKSIHTKMTKRISFFTIFLLEYSFLFFITSFEMHNIPNILRYNMHPKKEKEEYILITCYLSRLIQDINHKVLIGSF